MKEKHLPIALFNGTVATTNGIYEITDIDGESAKELIAMQGFVSAIGHEATAAIMAEVMQQPIEMNRIQFQQEVGQIAIVFKLNKRPDEGVVLTREELEQIGYMFKKMVRVL